VRSSSVLLGTSPVLTLPAMTFVHWYYPSALVGCGGDLLEDRLELRSSELTCLRGEVTCPSCLEQLRKDKESCEACRLGAPEQMPAHLAPRHICDPAIADRHN
jgi:hypothetical protein